MKTVNLKHLLYLIITFILFTVIGTFTHEGGHIAVAKYYGYETTLHYGSMESDAPWQPYADSLQSIYNKYPNRNSSHGLTGLDSLNAAKLRAKIGELYNVSVSRHITLGGPAQTLLTSILGIIILLYRRKSILTNGMNLWDWLAVFLALFSLRFVANMTLSILSELRKPNGTYFGGDEARIARSLQWPEGSVAIPLFCIGLAIALWVIFRVLPHKHRLTFILSGLIGGSAGYVIWLHWLGPIILP